MNTTAQWQTDILPAQLSFLAIYSPALGPTDETFGDQLVFYWSRSANNARGAQKTAGKAQDDRGGDENERLRQIGLAQGMVDFARSFSNEKPVDSIETDRSRIVIHELERGWWILASIDLTRLPLATSSTSFAAISKPTKTTPAASDSAPQYEYSSREVSPSALLAQQLFQAHCIFTLHHGTSLSDLCVKLSRDRFCNTLERHWSRFARTWDVLLHGNPAVDILSGIKLASGGELGFGVGEEEWGSGERAVLEEIANGTEGLIDLVVARFGEPPEEESENTIASRTDYLPWLGCGDHPTASDGIIFGGIGAISRPSLRNLSLWMQQIYTYGDHAYGVRDNPNRERRKKRRPRNVPTPVPNADISPETTQFSHSVQTKEDNQRKTTQQPRQTDPLNPSPLPKNTRPQPYDRVASHDHAANSPAPQIASHPGIPPPIVSAAEAALERATTNARQPSSRDVQGLDQEAEDLDSGTTMGIPDQYMKYLTFGLSTLGKSYIRKGPPSPAPPSESSSKTSNRQSGPERSAHQHQEEVLGVGSETPAMSMLDPIPDGDALHAKIAHQKRQENKGHFIIGLKGDLDSIPQDNEGDLTQGSLYDGTEGARTILRTIHIEVLRRGRKLDGSETSDEEDEGDLDVGNDPQEPVRLRVLVYAHRPFIYCFLFEQRTSSLSWSSFYRTMHRNLLPIHTPLLSSTSATNVAERVEAAHVNLTNASESYTVKPSSTASIFDLLYDPSRLTVHSSISNIPDPGTPAAEGISQPTKSNAIPMWSRLDALNVHSAILNTLATTAHPQLQIESTSKTSRGWWVVCMRITPSTGAVASSSNTDEDSGRTFMAGDDNGRSELNPIHRATPLARDMHRIAFLVRKATGTGTKSTVPSGSRAASGMWSALALTTKSSDDSGVGDKVAGLSTGGIGFDARKYIDNLLSLNR